MGKSYDIRCGATRGKIFVQVMWKYLEQASFPMTEADYFEHLDAVGQLPQRLGQHGTGGDTS